MKYLIAFLLPFSSHAGDSNDNEIKNRKNDTEYRHASSQIYQKFSEKEKLGN